MAALSSQIEVAARAFVELLTQELSGRAAGGSAEPSRDALVRAGGSTQTVPRPTAPVRAVNATGGAGGSTQIVPGPTDGRVSQAMKRQFPSMFRFDPPRGKKRFTTPANCVVKRTDFNVYALSGPSQLTPKGSEELELSHAGLGKRLISLPDHCNHNECGALVTAMSGVVSRELQRPWESPSECLLLGVHVCWFGWGGLQWGGLFSFFSHSLRGRAAPDVLIIHCGGSDMRKVSSVKLVSMIKEDLHQLHLHHPGIKIIFSSLAQTCRWEAGGNPAKIDKARKCVYS